MAKPRPSTRQFKFGGSGRGDAKEEQTVTVDEGPMAGNNVDLNVVDIPGDTTPALIGID